MQLCQDESSLIRVRDIVAADFLNATNIYFQLLATYSLVQVETGETRNWTGSFSPRNRVGSELTSHLPFEPESFVPFVLARTVPNEVHSKLSFGPRRVSVWRLDQVKSIIISFQTKLNVTDDFFRRRPLVERWRQRRRNGVAVQSTVFGPVIGSRRQNAFRFSLE